MLLPFFKAYVSVLKWLCIIGVTKQWWDKPVWPGFSCWPFESQSFAGPNPAAAVVFDANRPFGELTMADVNMVLNYS